MTTVSYAKSGHLASAPLQERKTVKAEWCISTCQCKVLEAWSTHHPNTGTSSLLLHHHNASAHTAATTLDYWNKITLCWPCTPYSTDLAPCDFGLFPQVKRQLKGKQFLGIRDAQAFFEGVIPGIPQSAWSDTRVTWFERMTKSVHAEERYFEKTGQEIDKNAQISASRNLWGHPRICMYVCMYVCESRVDICASRVDSHAQTHSRTYTYMHARTPMHTLMLTRTHSADDCHVRTPCAFR